MTNLHPGIITGARTRCDFCGNLAPVTTTGRVRAHNTTPGGSRCIGGTQPITNLVDRP